MTEPRGRPFLIDLDGPMEPFTHTLTVRFMNQEDTHSVKRWGTPIFHTFIRSAEFQKRLYARLKSRKVAMEHRRWVD